MQKNCPVGSHEMCDMGGGQKNIQDCPPALAMCRKEKVCHWAGALITHPQDIANWAQGHPPWGQPAMSQADVGASNTLAAIQELENMALDPTLDQCCRWVVGGRWALNVLCVLETCSSLCPTPSPHSIAVQEGCAGADMRRAHQAFLAAG